MTDDMMTMEVTELEYSMVDVMRSWPGHEKIEFTASCEDGVWEIALKMTPHHDYHDYKNCRNVMTTYRGVGTSVLEAFRNMAANDDEPVEDGWGFKSQSRPV